MKAKKLFVAAVLAVLGTSAQAQIVSSRSNQVVVTETPVVKEKKPILWYGKAGVSYDMNANNQEDYRGYWDDQDDGLGFEVGIGLKQALGNNGAYWGAEVGFMTALTEDPDSGDVKKDPSVYAIPYVGWEFKTTESISIAPYIGPFISYGFENTSIYAGASVGLNVWFNNKYAIGAGYKLLFDDALFHKISVDFSIAF